jgi:acetylornithine deacetylase/succinyl-diaminopimelate desuccinylase-like protein
MWAELYTGFPPSGKEIRTDRVATDTLAPVDVSAALDRIDAMLDSDELVELVGAFIKAPTGVPLGFDTYVDPTDPMFERYLADAVLPELTRGGAVELIDCRPFGVVARLGSGSTAVLIQSYSVSQHHQLMEDPYAPRVADGRIWGRGVSQSKGHQAVMVAVLRALARDNVDLGGTLLWSVNNEARSSHKCSDAIVARLPLTPSVCLLQAPTSLRISLGNRGRVDVAVTIEGHASHSSTPEAGASAIEGARRVMNRIGDLSWPVASDPVLGKRQAVVYKMDFEPVAPHTLPGVARLTVDRRLLPGDDPDAAVDELREWIGEEPPYRISVEGAEHMLPALVAPDDPHVRTLSGILRALRPDADPTFYAPGTFDAGATAARGIPTMMFGARGGDWPLGPDYVAIEDLLTEARALGAFILLTLSASD